MQEIDQMVEEKIHLNWEEGSRRKNTYGVSKKVTNIARQIHG